MADIDDDLLALAGDASSDEEDDAPTNISTEGSPAGNKSVGKIGAKKTGARQTGRRHNSSEEEGEASSGAPSPASLRSAPMSESDSESDAAGVYDDTERYPLEGKFINSSDRAEILALPEIKREELLAERAQEVERDRQNRALRQLLNAREAENRKQDKKRKAGAADLDDNQRKTSRQRTKLGGGKVGEPTTGIDSLKKARAAKDDRQRRRDEDKERNKDRRSQRDDYSDHDAEGESEVEWDDGRSKNRKRSSSPDYRDAEPAGLLDIERVRVGRSRFAKVCFYPCFDEAITGCFVRISIGVDKDTQQNIYRMGIIKGFVEDRPYAITAENGKQFKTTQYVRAAHGKAERNWPFITCSDSPFTESEWNRFKVTCHNEGVPVPTKPRLIGKITDINNLVNRSWTEEELQEKLTKSGALVNKFFPIERNRINNLIKEATSRGDVTTVDSLKAELEALEGPKLAYSTSMQSTPKKTVANQALSQQERLAIKNKENRRKNAEDVRQAQINERRATKMTEAAIARGEIVVEDHSRRLKTRAKVNHDVSEAFVKKTDSESGTNTPAVGTPNLSAKKTALPYIAKLQAVNGEKKGVMRRPVMDDDIIGSIDLGIDIDFEI